MNSMNIKKGDKVKVLAGKDKGKEGTIDLDGTDVWGIYFRVNGECPVWHDGWVRGVVRGRRNACNCSCLLFEL